MTVSEEATRPFCFFSNFLLRSYRIPIETIIVSIAAISARFSTISGFVINLRYHFALMHRVDAPSVNGLSAWDRFHAFDGQNMASGISVPPSTAGHRQVPQETRIQEGIYSCYPCEGSAFYPPRFVDGSPSSATGQHLGGKELSLERYINLLQVLCGWQPERIENLELPRNSYFSWRVRRLSKEDCKIMQLNDLRKIIALNGVNTIEKQRKAPTLRRMEGMELASPICYMDIEPRHDAREGCNVRNANNYPICSKTEQKMLEDGLYHALTKAVPTQAVEISRKVREQGYYSYCPLSNLESPWHIRERPSESTTTATTANPIPPLPLSLLQIHQSQEDGVADSTNPDVLMNDSLEPVATKSTWLASQVAELRSKVQVNIAELKSGSQLCGQKIACIFLENFFQADNTDKCIISRGIRIGQVIEWIGDKHDIDKCPSDCTNYHNYYLVRFDLDKKTKTAWDLEIELLNEARIYSLEDMLFLTTREADDAWAIVEHKAQ